MTEAIIEPKMETEPKLNGIGSGSDTDTYEKHNGAYFDYCQPTSSCHVTNGGLSEPNGDVECGLEQQKALNKATERQDIKLSDKKDAAPSIRSYNTTYVPQLAAYSSRIQPNLTQSDPQAYAPSEKLIQKKLKKERREKAIKSGWTKSDEIEGHKKFEDINAHVDFVGGSDTDKRLAKKSHGKIKKTKSGGGGGKSLSDGEGKPREAAASPRRERSASPQMKGSPKQIGAHSNSRKVTGSQSPPTFELSFDDSDFQPVGTRRRKQAKEPRSSNENQTKPTETQNKPSENLRPLKVPESKMQVADPRRSDPRRSDPRRSDPRRASSLEPNNNLLIRNTSEATAKPVVNNRESDLGHSSFPSLNSRRRSWGDVGITPEQPTPSSASLTDDESVKSQPVTSAVGEINSWAKIAKGCKINTSDKAKPAKADAKPKLSKPAEPLTKLTSVEDTKTTPSTPSTPSTPCTPCTLSTPSEAAKSVKTTAPKNQNQHLGSNQPPASTSHPKHTAVKLNSDQSAAGTKSHAVISNGKSTASSQHNSAIEPTPSSTRADNIPTPPSTRADNIPTPSSTRADNIPQTRLMSTSLKIDFLSMDKSINPIEDKMIIELLTKNTNGITLPYVPKPVPYRARKASSLPPTSSGTTSSRGVEFVDRVTHEVSAASGLTFGFPESLVFGFGINNRREERRVAASSEDKFSPTDTLNGHRQTPNGHRQIVASVRKQWQAVIDERNRQGSHKLVVWLDELS